MYMRFNLLLLYIVYIQKVQCFAGSASPSYQSQLWMSNEVNERRENVISSLRNVIPPTLDQNRRNAVTGTTAALLSLSFLIEESVSSRPHGPGVGGLAPVSEALLLGDTIVRNLWLSRLTYPVLIVCLEIGLFESLKDRPLGKEELGKRLHPKLNGNGRALEGFCAVMSSVGLLEFQSNAMVALTESARLVLLRDSPYFWGSQLFAADGLTSALRRAVSTEGQQGTKSYTGHSVEAIDSFIDSMQAHGVVTAQVTSEALDSVIGRTSQNPAHHILDMAGGSGCFAAALSGRYGVKVTLADLPVVIDKWRHEHRFSKKVEAVTFDLFDGESWPSNGPDCHFMANVLHDWSKQQVSLILEASYMALRRNMSSSTNYSSPRRLIVIEQLLSDNNSGPLPAALASVSMLLGDWRTGKQYSFSEIEELAKGVGFSKVEKGPKCGNFHTAVIAYI